MESVSAYIADGHVNEKVLAIFIKSHKISVCLT